MEKSSDPSLEKESSSGSNEKGANLNNAVREYPSSRNDLT